MCHLPVPASPKHNVAQGMDLMARSISSMTVSPGAGFHLSSQGRMPTFSNCLAIFSTDALSFELWLRKTSNVPSAFFASTTRAAVMRWRPALASTPSRAFTTRSSSGLAHERQ